MLTIPRNLDLLQKAWVSAILVFLFLNSTISLARAAESSSATVKGTDASGTTVMLLVDRDPALYTGDFGDCMGGQSLINLTSFDAAYYADNMTVLFNMAGSTNLRNESLMIYISVQAYGEDRFNLVFNPCNANFESLCPLNNSVPIRGQALIPVSRADVAGIPSIALNIPDFEGSAILRIFSNSSQTQIGCFSAVMRNGSTLSHPGFIGTFLTIFTIVGIASSFATTVWAADKPENLAHYAHSLPVLLIFEVFQSIFFSGALSLNWPSILAAWWSNFALFSGMIYTPGIIKSLNSFVGISGNSSQVGGAGSTILNNNGGLQQQIYGRSLPMTTRDLVPDVGDMVNYLSKRATANNDSPRLYDWAGLPVAPGLPLPGNWSGFAGELSMVGIPAADAFLNGFIWLLTLTIIILSILVIFKLVLEGLNSIKWIKNDCLAHFRTQWLKYVGRIILRTGFISFFMIMTLSLYQFSYGGKAGQVVIAVIVFLITFGGCLAACFYVTFYQIQNNYCEMKPDGIPLQPQKHRKSLNLQNTTDNKLVDDKEEFESSLSVSHTKIKTLVAQDNQSQEIHGYIKIRKRYGWLLARYRSTRWWFFIVWVIYQFVRACLIGGAREHPMAQVIGLFIWEIIAFVTLIIINPWEGTRNTVLAVWLLGISKVVTSGLSIAFLPQFYLPRISSTIIGIIIVITQGLLVLSLLILIILGAVSSYMSLTRDQEQFKPENLKDIRLRYFAKIENKPKINSHSAIGESPEKMKEPYFSVKSFRREPKIDDEGSTAMRSIYNYTASHTSLPCHDSISRPFSRVDSMTESLQKQGQNYGNKAHGTQPAHKIHDINQFHEFNRPDTNESSRAGTPLGLENGSIINYNKITAVPLIRPCTPVSCLKPAMPSVEQQMLFASQRMNNSR
ncbi:Flavin carrier protein 2 [Golovinomyces cichoracearum]|uniref:Flavin carrier protein 2 n=1 Tax=Golovinomyces cichoracearum TaxID=62708 RepID=A0A420HIJ4_9PEZI|nr:Flavin carrier protein 2 [Golovinomyces cichoracearum]